MEFTLEQLESIARNAEGDEFDRWVSGLPDGTEFPFKVSDLAEYAATLRRVIYNIGAERRLREQPEAIGSYRLEHGWNAYGEGWVVFWDRPDGRALWIAKASTKENGEAILEGLKSGKIKNGWQVETGAWPEKSISEVETDFHLRGERVPVVGGSFTVDRIKLGPTLRDRLFGQEIPAIPPPGALPEAGSLDRPSPFPPGRPDGIKNPPPPPRRQPVFDEAASGEIVAEAKAAWARGERAFSFATADGVTELFDSGPQRPHESLVWAIYHAAISANYGSGGANALLKQWKDRWPEDPEG